MNFFVESACLIRTFGEYRTNSFLGGVRGSQKLVQDCQMPGQERPLKMSPAVEMEGDDIGCATLHLGGKRIYLKMSGISLLFLWPRGVLVISGE